MDLSQAKTIARWAHEYHVHSLPPAPAGAHPEPILDSAVEASANTLLKAVRQVDGMVPLKSLVAAGMGIAEIAKLVISLLAIFLKDNPVLMGFLNLVAEWLSKLFPAAGLIAAATPV